MNIKNYSEDKKMEDIIALMLTHYPRFLMELNSQKLEVEVACEGCGNMVTYPAGEYLGVEWCGICPRAVVTMNMSNHGHMVNCPPMMSLNFLMFAVWWQRINGKEVKN